MGGMALGLMLALGLQASPIYLSRQVFPPQVCAKKRVDACGCHHVYGMRHCHPNRKTDHCEAPVSTVKDVTVKNAPQSL